MDMQFGYHSATQQSWQRDNMRELLTALMEEHPRADLKKLTKLFIERMRNEEDHLVAAGSYAVNNTFNAIQKFKEQAKARAAAERPEARQAREQAREERAAQVKEVAAKLEQAILLNLEMPNGKRMRNCTGAEMATFGKGYQKIAAKVGSTKLVGQVLDEKQVRTLMK